MSELNILQSSNIKQVHFVGIGGISMSGLAEILLNLGYKITGSDIKSSNITDKLKEKGAEIYFSHSEENIQNQDLVVYTAAVKETNPELVKAKSLGIPTVERATLLGQIMKCYPYSIAISGTHGKTTTTSMVTMVMIESGLDPTVHIGGELSAIGGNTKIGGNDYFITEACEYVESFLKFYPYLAIILNIEADHLDYFKDLNHIKESFIKFASLVPKDGYIVACMDDGNTMSIMDRIGCNKITYSIKSDKADWYAQDISFDEFGRASYDLYHDKKFISRVNLGVQGMHNVSNSLGAAAACHTLGCSIEHIKNGLSKFTGTKRRYQLKGVANEVKVIDDYAHHPSEITATLKAASNSAHERIWCVFQPHTYTRTKALLEDFAVSFKDADNVIIADIYAAREPDRGEIHASTLADKIKLSGKNAIYMSGFEQIVDYLAEHAERGDLIITMGAGDIYKVGELYLKKMNVLELI